MQLNILDRFMIQAIILPKQGNLIENTLTDSISDMIKFTPEEISQYRLMGDYKNEELAASPMIDYVFTAEQVQIMKTGVHALDASKTIPRQANKTCLKILNYPL